MSSSIGRFTASISLSGLLSGENKKPTIILILTPLILTTWKYFGTKSFYLSSLSSSFVWFGNLQQTAELYTFLSALVLFGILPLILIRFVFKEPLSAYGLQMGDWRFGLKAFLVLAPVFALASFFSRNDPEFVAEYPLFKGAGASQTAFLAHAFSYLLFYIGWETYFRGFIQFGLRHSMGDWQAILVQTALSCILHIGKPAGEIYSSVLGALVWGIIVFRARSIFFVILMHWILGVVLDYSICFLR
jgi:membrane protease YdiL (CAAX protease family)